VPEVCVGSGNEVRSVILVSKLKDLKGIRTVALDESSRTSAALVKIVFLEFLGVEPEWKSERPNLERMLADNDAALLIGDPGMTFRPEGLTIFDMASFWRTYTSLGFVFAMWAISTSACANSYAIDFAGACKEGLDRMEEIIDFYHPLLGLPREDLENYLRQNITFTLNSELRAGLELYYQLAHKHRLIDGLKPLNL
jgi:chorismate dehydratase